MTISKTCTKCGVDKPLDAFSPAKRGKYGRKSHCKGCHAAYQRHKYATDPGYVERQRDRLKAWHRGEKLDPIGLSRPVDERFDDFLMPEPNTGCLLWTGGQFLTGYGKFKVNGKTFRVHRFAYWRHWKVIDKPEIHHKCGNPLCCNPEHLQAVTPEEHKAIHASE